MEKVREMMMEAKKEISKEKIQEWVNQIAESSSELPHYLENKTFNILSKEMENALIQNLISPKSFMEKLDGYRLVDEIHELFRGKYIRWIRKNNVKPTLTNGAMVMDIKFLPEGIHVLCRNGANRFIQIKFDDCILFQKLTDEEWMLLSVKSQI